MKVSAKSTVLIFALLFGAAMNIFAQFSINESPLPAPTAPVNDFANVIDDEVERQLNQKIIEFKARTNPQVVLAVATVRTTNGRPIEEYSLAVGRGWKIGTSEADNPSALIFIAIDDKKYFTLVSKDLQDELPDGLAGQLQRQYLVPAFKQGDYTKGIADTIDAYIRTVEAKQTGATVPASGETNQPKEKSPVSTASFGLCLIIGFILLLVIFSRAAKSRSNRNDRDGWGGGGFGGGGALPWIVGSIIAGSGSGGSSSNDSSSGGGSDWGGFGGGGDFDGGGAGGDW